MDRTEERLVDFAASLGLGDIDSPVLHAIKLRFIDTIGCGDAYFALSSVAACLRLPARLVALAGSIGAAAMTQRRCNERPVSEQEFMTIAKIVI